MNNAAKIVVIYHRADFDGLFSREIARRHFGENAEYIGWDYGDPLPVIPPKVESLFMIDISVDGLMDHEKLVWIDHHLSAMNKYGNDIPGYRIDGVAACRLAYQWFNNPCGPCVDMLHPAPPILPSLDDYRNRMVTEPLAVRLAGEYDIWDKRDPRAELFQHGLRSVEELDWTTLLKLDDPATGSDGHRYVNELLKGGEVLQRARERENESIITKQGFTVQFEGLNFLACNAARYNSHLFRAGLRPEHDGCLGFNWDGGKRKWRFSLYGVPGKPDVNLGAIAVKHGGGGHKQACGFESDVLPFALGGNS